MWYYTLNDQQAGPVSQAELSQMLQSSLPIDTLVWKEGMADWVQANTLDVFQSLSSSLPNTPPPLATAPAVSAPSSNPYTAPVASSHQSYQTGDYPLPKVKKANFGLLISLISIGTLLMIGGYIALFTGIMKNATAAAYEEIEQIENIERLEPIEQGQGSSADETDPAAPIAPEDLADFNEVLTEEDSPEYSEHQVNPFDSTSFVSIGIVMLGWAIMAAGSILGLVYVHRAWQLLQPTQTTITPGQAVGFMFIPFFNLYWMFIAYHKWAVEWNNTCRQHTSLTYAPRGAEGPFLAMAICYCASVILSIFGLLASAVLYIIGMKSMCNAINFAAENGEAPNQPFR